MPAEGKYPKDLNYEDIKIGDAAEFERNISAEDVAGFARLSGDHNPLHVDPNYGQTSRFHGNVVHGMFLSSLFSTLVGMHCPGKKSLYLSQTLNFKLPVKPGETVTVKGIVTGKIDAVSMIILKTEILSGGRTVVDGEARVRVL